MREGKASRTAQQNALFRALETRRPLKEQIARDGLAVRFLPPSFRVLAELARIPPLLRVIESVIDRRWPGPRAGQLVRTAYIDDAIGAALNEVDQILVLGAGFDTRAYRIRGIDGCTVFEVDHPSTQRVKRRIVERYVRSSARHVVFVPVDFGRDDLQQALAASGFVTSARTLVLWEGVTNYLTDEIVDDVLRCLHSITGPGSTLLFTYIDRGILDGSRSFAGAAESGRAVRKVGEPYTFGLDPVGIGEYLGDRGFDLVEDNAVSELAPRYYTNGRRPPVYAYYHVVAARRR